MVSLQCCEDHEGLPTGLMWGAARAAGRPPLPLGAPWCVGPAAQGAPGPRSRFG
jgi:hypothetical protein